jgi:hypothetical protein
MKRLFVVALFFLVLSVSASAKKDDGDFPLTVHITAVHMEQGQTGVSGHGGTDSNGNYSSSVGGGESYTWKLYTAQVVGDPKTYELSTPDTHYKGGKVLAIATGGFTKMVTSRPNDSLHIGDYRGRWNKNGTLEIQFCVVRATSIISKTLDLPVPQTPCTPNDANEELIYQTFMVESEDITPTPNLPIPTSVTPPLGAMANLTVESNIPGADIEIDGSFVGNTPSTVAVAPGHHQILVKKKGFTDWTKALNVTGGTIHLNAELEQKPAK